MPHSNNMGAFERWNCRVLGFLWTLGGLLWLREVLPSTDWWQDTVNCLAVILAALLIVAGSGLAFCRIWALWSMIPLMVGAGLMSLDGVLCAAFCGTFSFLILSFVGVMLAGYTLMLVSVSLWTISSGYV